MILKRDGRRTKFDKTKIVNAIKSAFENTEGEVYDEYAESKAKNIADYIETNVNESDKMLSVEDIQDLVEKGLMSCKKKNVAKEYILYRAERTRARKNTTDNELQELLNGQNEYWNTENSNKNPTVLHVQRDYMAGIVSTDLTNRYLLDKDIVEAHKEGILHFHDADYFGMNAITNCSLINLEDMLQNGTVINERMIEKPHRFITAMNIATQIITGVTSSQYGGTTITLTHLAPFVRSSYNIHYQRNLSRIHDEELAKQYAYEDTLKEISDAVQLFNYQCNTMTTTNGQAPFVTVFMYLGETEEYKYELSLIIEEFLKQRLDGMKNEVGEKVTQEFPKLIYVLEEDNIHEDSKYWYLTRLSAECTAKRFVPDYVSEKICKQLKEGNCFPSMGCRSSLSPWVDGNGKYKFYGRFNQGVVTLNLVDVALSSKGDIDKFWKLMDERSELVHRALMIRHKRLEGTPSDVAPIIWQHGAFARLNKHEKIDKLLHNGYSTISFGYAGLYECVRYMTGCSHADNGIGEKFGLDVLKFMNDKCDEWNKQHYVGFSIYGSPIESTTYKFAKCLKKRFGVIEGITDHDYITNSYHINVREEINPFDKLTIEAKFQALSKGGAVSYVECANVTDNIDAVLTIMKHIYNTIMYAELNIKSDYCHVCGYNGEIKIVDVDGKLDWECPNCGNRDHDKMNVSRRTCGYIGAHFWNQGRTQEIAERYVHLDCHEMRS